MNSGEPLQNPYIEVDHRVPLDLLSSTVDTIASLGAMLPPPETLDPRLTGYAGRIAEGLTSELNAVREKLGLPLVAVAEVSEPEDAAYTPMEFESIEEKRDYFALRGYASAATQKYDLDEHQAELMEAMIIAIGEGPDQGISAGQAYVVATGAEQVSQGETQSAQRLIEMVEREGIVQQIDGLYQFQTLEIDYDTLSIVDDLETGGTIEPSDVYAFLYKFGPSQSVNIGTLAYALIPVEEGERIPNDIFRDFIAVMSAIAEVDEKVTHLHGPHYMLNLLQVDAWSRQSRRSETGT